MKRVNYLSYSMIPQGMYQWDAGGREVKDVVLSSVFAKQKCIAKMKLNISKITVFSEDGAEHLVQQVSGQHSLEISGLASGELVRSKKMAQLQPGKYQSLRLYLASQGGTFSFTDRSEQQVKTQKYLDFDFEGGLSIRGNEAPEFILRFDLPAYRIGKLSHSFKQLFRRQGLRAKLASSLSN